MALPKISIVTPSYNQADFLEGAIRSVLEQKYPALEYVIIDGGSNDGSRAVLEQHGPSLTYWVSEPDNGQYAAIAKGFARTSGEIMGWLNSDDQYTPWAFSVVGEIFERFPDIEWLTTLYPIWWDHAGRAVHCEPLRGFSRTGFWSGEHLPSGNHHYLGFIQQESTFWRRSLWERAGGLDTSFRAAGDFDLWARFFAAGAELVGAATPLGGFRLHPNQKTSLAYDAYISEAEGILRAHGGRRLTQVHRCLRELASRAPAITHSNLSKLGLMHACQICRYDRGRQDWFLTERFI